MDTMILTVVLQYSIEEPSTLRFVVRDLEQANEIVRDIKRKTKSRLKTAYVTIAHDVD